MRLYLKDPKRSRTKKEFFSWFFEQRCPGSYLDKECTNLESSRGSGRTIRNLYAIGKVLYSSLTYQELADILMDLAIDNKIGVVPCNMAKGVTFHHKYRKYRNWMLEIISSKYGNSLNYTLKYENKYKSNKNKFRFLFDKSTITEMDIKNNKLIINK